MPVARRTPTLQTLSRECRMRRIAVSTSPIHGRGVFALARIAVGDLLIEYQGKIIIAKQAERRVN